MVRNLIVVISVVMFGATAVAAESCQDIIDKRQAFMKRSAAEAKIGSAMIKGETPFDLAKVKEILAIFAEDATAMPTLFPDCSKTGDHTTASASIWDNAADFKVAVAKFQADVKAAQDSVKDLDSLKVGFQTISQDCSSCHQTFRMRRS